MLGALGELRCLDAATGKLLWRRNILADNGAPNLDWGMAASPLIVDDKVIVLPGGSPGRSVVAYAQGHRRAGLARARRRSGLHVADARRRLPARRQMLSSPRRASWVWSDD